MNSASEPSPARGSLLPALRWWPALALVALLWILHFLPNMVAEQTPAIFMLAFFGPVACALLLLIWWTFFSRARSRERWLGAAGLILILVLTTLFSHDSFRGLGTIARAIPWGFTVFALALVGADFAARPRRLVLALSAALLTFGLWSLVRIEGVWGDFEFERSWRWERTTEDLLLAELDQRQARGTERSGELGEVEWPGFRGTDRNSTVPGVTLVEDWEASPPRELWRIKVGPGWSSFAVAGNRLFTQEQRGENEIVVSYDAATGAELWVHAYASRFWETMGGVGPRATPTLSEGRLFALGAEGLMHRLDPVSGAVVWQADLRVDAGRQPPEWGFASSPLVVDDLVIVHAGGEGDRGVLAYDAETGDFRWGAPAGGHSYSSAQLSHVAGQLTVPVVTDDGLTLLDPADGTVRLEYSWPFNNYRVLQPLVLDDETLLMSTGMGVGTRRLDLSVEGEKLTVRERWTSRYMKPDFNDYVAHEGHLYGFDPSILACVDLETGERRWKGGRYGHGQVLLLPDSDQLLVLAETGELVLVRADPGGHEELARFPVLEGKTWNHPVIVGNRVFVRNAQEAVALEVPIL